LRLERMVWFGPETKAELEDCDRRIKEIEIGQQVARRGCQDFG
jgi:hypothetical protein